MVKIYPITPVAKCRMTRRDKWLDPPRPGVAKYRAFKDQVRAAGVKLPYFGAHVTFYIPMPRSWSKKKKKEVIGRPHVIRPDFDNLIKALSDAVYDEDCMIWDVRITKRWADEGAIEIFTEEEK